MKTKRYISTLAQYGFILLWGCALAFKLRDIAQWQRELRMQLFPLWIADILWWVLPAVQVVLVLLLLYKPTVQTGIKLSTVLITAFNLYLLLGVTKVFGATPCACGGIWSGNDHWLHIKINSIFIALGIIYWVSARRSRPVGDVLSDVRRKEGTDFL